MICPNCKKDNAAAAKFCASCGASFNKKNGKNRILRSILLVLILLAVLFLAAAVAIHRIYGEKISSLNDNGSVQIKNIAFRANLKTNQDANVAETVPARGKIIPPNGMKPESFEIFSLDKVSEIDNDGNFSASIYKDGVTVVVAVPENSGHELSAINLSDAGFSQKPLELTAKSTAAAVIFETPFFLTSDPERAKLIMDIIESDAEVEKFVRVIETAVGREDYLNDENYKTAFKQAVESVLGRLGGQ